MPLSRTVTASLLLAVTLAGCRIDLAAEDDVPEGYHRMPNGMLMADVQMETEYRDIMGDGILLPTHTRPDGTVVLGPAPVPGEHGTGHDHDLPDPAGFPQGVVPVAVQLPRIELSAPVVATALSIDRIEGPPVAGDLAWLDATRRPGQIGPAIIGGVDALDGEPGAFARLDEVQPGDELVVVGEDGELLPFAVESTEWSPVSARAEVFEAGDPRPEVRLVAWAVTGDADYVVRAFPLAS